MCTLHLTCDNGCPVSTNPSVLSASYDASSPFIAPTPSSVAASEIMAETGCPACVFLPVLNVACATRAAHAIVDASVPPPPMNEANGLESLILRALTALIELSLTTPEGFVYTVALLLRAASIATTINAPPVTAFLTRLNVRRMVVAAASIVGKFHEDRYYTLPVMARTLLHNPNQSPSAVLLATVEAAEWRLLEHVDYDVLVSPRTFDGTVEVLFDKCPPRGWVSCGSQDDQTRNEGNGWEREEVVLGG